ncbi:MAG: cbb3-type cytochrome oxidase assembly protein CcoS [Thermoflexibacteraceae bacterium]|jgi:cbb3-type cytochrome oxidase maturation protein
MSVIYLLLAVSLCMGLIFLFVFLFALKDEQYEDDVTPAIRILFDNKTKTKNTTNKPANISPTNLQNTHS